MDVEGLEYNLLASAPELLAPGGPALWLECNPSERSLQLADLLLSAGLSVHYFAFPAFASDNFRQDPEPIFPFAFESGLWATRGPPPELSAPLAQRGCILERISTSEDLRRALWRTPRWGMADWQGASFENIVAEAAHLYLGETYARFLSDEKPHDLGEVIAEQRRLIIEQGREVATLTDSLAQVRQALSNKDQQLANAYEELAAAYIVLDDERSQNTLLQDRLRASADLKAILETRIAFADRKAADAAERADALQETLRTIELSSTWRATHFARALFSRHPGLKGVFRFWLIGVYRLARGLHRGVSPRRG